MEISHQQFSRQHDQIVVSTAHATHVFYFDDKNVISLVEAVSSSFRTDTRTVAVGNIAVDEGGSVAYAVQITSKRIHVFEYDPNLREFSEIVGIQAFHTVANRDPTGHSLDIVSASIQENRVLLSMTGGYISLLEVVNGGLKPVL